MVLSVIMIFTAVAAVASIVNLLDKKPEAVPLKAQMPGNLPILSLSNNGKVFNFIIDSGSNISHICAEYYESLDTKHLGTDSNHMIQGLGGTSVGVTMCNATFKDIVGKSYEINLAVSTQLGAVAKNIESVTGFKVHGLLGTDFLRENRYVINFDTLTMYSNAKGN